MRLFLLFGGSAIPLAFVGGSRRSAPEPLDQWIANGGQSLWRYAKAIGMAEVEWNETPDPFATSMTPPRLLQLRNGSERHGSERQGADDSTRLRSLEEEKLAAEEAAGRSDARQSRVEGSGIKKMVTPSAQPRIAGLSAGPWASAGAVKLASLCHHPGQRLQMRFSDRPEGASSYKTPLGYLTKTGSDTICALPFRHPLPKLSRGRR